MLGDIRNGVNQKDFDKVIKRLEKENAYRQILDEWKYFTEKVGDIKDNVRTR